MEDLQLSGQQCIKQTYTVLISLEYLIPPPQAMICLCLSQMHFTVNLLIVLTRCHSF